MKISVRTAAAIFAALLSLGASPAPAAPIGADAKSAPGWTAAAAEKLRRAGGTVAILAQEKYVGLMDEKIFGKILLAADARGNVRWQMLSPYESLSILRDGALYNFEKSGGKWVRVKSALDERMADVFRTVARMAMCDFSKPVEGFDTSAEGDKISLTPSSETLRRAISKITLLPDARKERAGEIRIDNADGDYLILRIESARENPEGIDAAFDVDNPGLFPAPEPVTATELNFAPKRQTKPARESKPGGGAALRQETSNAVAAEPGSKSAPATVPPSAPVSDSKPQSWPVPESESISGSESKPPAARDRKDK